ncbi:MAG TPA: DNA translocase FtsK [Patescibacteria group bacterium]|jgi:hypothetical protein|nr:DNA translocase FtsK [Patescibacteria group bacterium]
MKAIKDLFTGALGIGLFLAIIIISAIFLIFGLRIASAVYPILETIAAIFIIISLFIFLPLALFKKTRMISIYGFSISAFIFAINVWIFSLLTTYFYWGIFGVVVGIMLGGIGEIPIAAIASLLHGDWTSIFNIISTVVLFLIAQGLAAYLGSKVEKEANLKENSEYIQTENIIEATGVNQLIPSIYATPTYLADKRDEIYPEVKEFITVKKEITVSDLQKKFAIGYSRGARIMDHLEEDSLVSGAEGGGKSRKVLNNDLQGKKIVECLEAFGIQAGIDEINHKKNGIEYCLNVALGSPMEEIVIRGRDIAAIVESPTGKVKIQAPIPGRSQVGILVPTKN